MNQNRTKQIGVKEVASGHEIRFMLGGKAYYRVYLSHDLKEAVEVRRQILRDIKMGVIVHLPDVFDRYPYFVNRQREATPTVKSAARRFILHKRPHMKSTKNYETKLAIFSGAFGQKRVSDIRWREVDRFLCDRYANRRTAVSILTPFKAMFQWLYDEEVIKENPLRGHKISMPPAPREKVDPFTPEEIEKLFAKAGQHLKYYLRILPLTGMRPGEAFALQWHHVSDSQISVQCAVSEGKISTPKTPQSIREIDLLPATKRWVNKQRALTQLRSEFVFLDKNGKPWTDPEMLRAEFRDLCARAKVRYRKPYSLRHTYGSWMLSAGEQEEYIAAQMGHKDTKELRLTYGSWIPEVGTTAGQAAARTKWGANS